MASAPSLLFSSAGHLIRCPGVARSPAWICSTRSLQGASLCCGRYPCPMRPADLTSFQIAEQLAWLYAADQGQPSDAPGMLPRVVLADHLGCHEEVRAQAWAVWAARLNPLDWDAAEYWLDVDFPEPCPEYEP